MNSQNDFLYDLFEKLDSKNAASATAARKKPTVSYQFKVLSRFFV
jgi:hypothetical protein